MEDPKAARAVLLGLRALGVQLINRRLWRGYSSLAYLQTLPVERAKSTAALSTS
jgi:EAL domain-containing protein (putative c-di-GMP-specific phosphodiesterase class I)